MKPLARKLAANIFLDQKEIWTSPFRVDSGHAVAIRSLAMRHLLLTLAITLPLASAELTSGPSLPNQLVKDWAQMPAGRNFGATTGVDADRNGKVQQSWTDLPIKASRGIRVGPDGNIWGVGVKGHRLNLAALEMACFSQHQRPRV